MEDASDVTTTEIRKVTYWLILQRYTFSTYSKMTISICAFLTHFISHSHDMCNDLPYNALAHHCTQSTHTCMHVYTHSVQQTHTNAHNIYYYSETLMRNPLTRN